MSTLGDSIGRFFYARSNESYAAIILIGRLPWRRSEASDVMPMSGEARPHGPSTEPALNLLDSLLTGGTGLFATRCDTGSQFCERVEVAFHASRREHDEYLGVLVAAPGMRLRSGNKYGSTSTHCHFFFVLEFESQASFKDVKDFVVGTVDVLERVDLGRNRYLGNFKRIAGGRRM
ncbi:MAG TPA: hypothetical protein VFY10_11010 [Dehalococcoidia bacterium]|nr:hypothetical protein [Dehalococcoidia bacterium]